MRGEGEKGERQKQIDRQTERQRFQNQVVNAHPGWQQPPRSQGSSLCDEEKKSCSLQIVRKFLDVDVVGLAGCWQAGGCPHADTFFGGAHLLSEAETMKGSETSRFFPCCHPAPCWSHCVLASGCILSRKCQTHANGKVRARVCMGCISPPLWVCLLGHIALWRVSGKNTPITSNPVWVFVVCDYP